MKFKSLKIEKELWGEKKGQLIAEIAIDGKNSSTKLVLPNEVGEKILKLAKSAIIDAVEEAANDFIFEITAGIPETMKIESK